jgi:hypothetical protein
MKIILKATLLASIVFGQVSKDPTFDIRASNSDLWTTSDACKKCIDSD